MKSRINNAFGPGLVVMFCLLMPGLAEGQSMESMARRLAATYAELRSLSVKVRVERAYQADFMRYREESKQPMLIPWPSNTGDHHYFAMEGVFGAEMKIRWGNGELMAHDRKAWNGRLWQSVSWKMPDKVMLDLSQRRRGSMEAGLHAGSPLEWGFPFLIVATSRASSGNFAEDDHLWRVTLDKMRDIRVWQSFAQRLRGKVMLAERQGQPCWMFSVDAGMARGSRNMPVYYKVWLPVAAPVYPVRVETRAVEKNYLLGELEVSQFSDAVDIGADTPLRFPQKCRSTSYTTDPRWRGKAVSVTDYEVSERTFNPLLADTDFNIDRTQAHVITQWDTGQMTFQKSRGK